MGCTVAELEKRISAHEYQKHLADYSIAPFGERRADYRIAFAFAQLANVMRGTEDNPAPFSFRDFLLPVDAPFEQTESHEPTEDEPTEDEPTEDEIVEEVRELANMFGWEIKKISQ